MLGDQGLVGRDHVLAVGDGLEHQVAGDVIAADQLHDDIDLGIVHHQVAVIDDLDFSLGQFGRAGSIASGDHGNFNAPACTARNLLLVALENIESTGTHGADAEQTYFDGFHIVFVVGEK